MIAVNFLSFFEFTHAKTAWLPHHRLETRLRFILGVIYRSNDGMYIVFIFQIWLLRISRGAWDNQRGENVLNEWYRTRHALQLWRQLSLLSILFKISSPKPLPLTTTLSINPSKRQQKKKKKTATLVGYKSNPISFNLTLPGLKA